MAAMDGPTARGARPARVADPRTGPGTGGSTADLAGATGLLAGLPGGVLVHDGCGRLVGATDAALDLLGLTRAQLAGDDQRPAGWKLLPGHPRDTAEVGVPPPATWVEGTPVVGRLVGVDPGGGDPVRWVRVDSAVHRGDDGAVSAVVTTVHDATRDRLVRDAARVGRRLVARAARTGSDRPDELTEHVLAAVGRVSGAARTLRSTLDRSAGELVLTHEWSATGAPWPVPERSAPIDVTTRILPYLARDEPVIIRDALTTAELPGVRDSLEEWGVRSGVIAPITVDGRLEGLFAISWGHPHDPDREIVALAVLAATVLAGTVACRGFVEEHRALEEQLAERERSARSDEAAAAMRAELYRDVAAELLVVVDADDRFLDCYGGALYQAELVRHLLGRSVLDLFDEADRERLAGVLRRTREEGRGEVFEFTWPGETMSRRFEACFRPAGQGRVAALVREVTAWEATGRIPLEESTLLAMANERLTRVVQERDEFLAGVSHELRTPLNAILGLTEMLLDDRADPVSTRQAGTLRTIESSGRHLLALINDLLDLSRLRAQVDVLDLDDVAVAEPCGLAFELIRPRAERKGLHLELANATDELHIRADERRLRQVVLNLLDNAVKFTDPGGSVGLTVARPDDEHVSVTVWDTGVGIAADDQARIFEPFTQLDGRRSGSGLGLALVDRLVALHGGDLEVDAAPGRGSRFTVVLPVAGPRRP